MFEICEEEISKLLDDFKNSDENKKEIITKTKKIIEIKNSKNYLIIFGKNNYGKRNIFKKAEIKKEKIRNTTKFKKNYR